MNLDFQKAELGTTSVGQLGDNILSIPVVPELTSRRVYAYIGFSTSASIPWYQAKITFWLNGSPVGNLPIMAGNANPTSGTISIVSLLIGGGSDFTDGLQVYLPPSSTDAYLPSGMVALQPIEVNLTIGDGFYLQATPPSFLSF